MPKREPFFRPGADLGSSYEALRVETHHETARGYIEALWLRYEYFADSHFLTDAQSHFHERFWEMYLACALMDRGLDLKPSGGVGPDYYFTSDRRKIWIEAVAPGPGSGADRAPEITPGVVSTIEHDLIVLRLTGAVRDKKILMEAARDKGIIAPTDYVLLGINHKGIPKAFMGSTIPFIAKAVLSFGHLSVAIDRETREIVDSHYTYNPSVGKQSGKTVSTEAFLDPAYSIVSGIISSGVDCVNYPNSMGEDFLLLHNPTAANPLDTGTLRWCRQAQYKESQLVYFEPEI